MISRNISCPVCSNKTWQVTGNRLYSSEDIWWKQDYTKLQKNIFFNMWNKEQNDVEMKRLVCKSCGFVTDIPRPEQKDILEKYSYLAKVEKNLGALIDQPDQIVRNENKQALKIFKLLKRYINSEEYEILDYGGGDGHILKPLVDDYNVKGYIVDYNKFPVEKVAYLGESIKSIPKELRFDAIICRHVIEHLSSPRLIVEELRELLKTKGVIYAEVPIEIYKYPLPNIDPVTHLNYFQENSFKILFESCGFKIPYVKAKKMTYHGKESLAVKLIAIKSERKEGSNYDLSYKRTLSYMFPTIFFRLKTKIRTPFMLIKGILNRLNNESICNNPNI